jgi:hypothetical protein
MASRLLYGHVHEGFVFCYRRASDPRASSARCLQRRNGRHGFRDHFHVGNRDSRSPTRQATVRARLGGTTTALLLPSACSYALVNILLCSCSRRHARRPRTTIERRRFAPGLGVHLFAPYLAMPVSCAGGDLSLDVIARRLLC